MYDPNPAINSTHGRPDGPSPAVDGAGPDSTGPDRQATEWKGGWP